MLERERERERIGNKRPMGHIAHLRNQFKFKKNHIAQNYDNIITLIRRAKTSLSLFWRNECSLLQDHSQELEMVGAKLLGEGTGGRLRPPVGPGQSTTIGLSVRCQFYNTSTRLYLLYQ